jgi:alpha-1,6-mannosyltransferase
MQHFLVAFAILLETIYVFVASSSDYRANLLPFFALSATATLAAFFFARRASLRSALLWGALFRATVAFRSPDLSEDLYRYAWDGHVSLAGVSPYARAPDDPELARLRNDDWDKSAHRDALSVYPPVSQAVFRAAARTGHPRVLLKVVFGAADLSIVWLLSRFEGGLFAAALYAALPLPVFESAGMGHLDSAGVALLLAALLHLRRRRPVVAGAAFALSVMTKYFAGFAALPFGRRGRLRFAGAAIAVASAAWVAGSGGGANPAAGLTNFATRWSGNSILYPAVESAVERTRLAPRAKAAYARWKSRRPERPWMELPWPWFYPELFARLILAAGLGIALVVIAIRIPDPVRAAGASLGAFLLASPVLHPWYLLWVLPFAALFRTAAFLYLSVSAMFGYALLHPVAPFSPGVVLSLEYGPFAALLALDVFRRGRTAPPSHDPGREGGPVGPPRSARGRLRSESGGR